MGIQADLSCHSLIMLSLLEVLIPFPRTPELHFLRDYTGKMLNFCLNF